MKYSRFLGLLLLACLVHPASAQITIGQSQTLSASGGFGGDVNITNGALLTINNNAFIELGPYTLFTGGNNLAPATGSLLLSNGSLHSTNAYVGYESPNTGSVTVTGSSAWTTSNLLAVGGAGAGSLTVTAGGTVAGYNVVLGDSPSGTGTVSVSGAGSLLAGTVNPIWVGYYGSGELTLANSGTVVASNGGGDLALAYNNPAANSTVNIGAAAASPAAAAGIAAIYAVNGGAGHATLQFNTTGTAAAPTYFTRTGVAGGVGVLVEGSTRLVHTAGYTVFTGALIHTGGTIINGGTMQIGDGGTAGSIGSNITNNGTLAFKHSDTVTYTSVISGSGGLAQLGTGNLILSNANTYTGGTTVNAGALTISSSGSLASTGLLTVNAGTVYFSNPAGQTIGGLAGNGGIISVAGGTTLTVNHPAGGGQTSLTQIANSGNVVMNFASNDVSSLFGANTYTGTTTISGGGTVRAGVLADGGVASTIGAATNAASNLIFNNGTLRYVGTGASTDRLFTINASTNGIIESSGLGALSFTNSGSLEVNGGAYLGLSGDNTGNNLFAPALGGASRLIKTGAGTWAVTTQNTYTGYTMISGTGVLGVSSLANGGTASNLGASANAAGNLIFDGGTLRFTGSSAGSTDRLFSVGVSGGTLDASGTTALVFNNTGAMDFNGQTGARALTLRGTSINVNSLAAVIGDNGGATSITKLDGGIWKLTGNNSYTGATNIGEGELRVSTLADGGVASNLGAASAAAANLVIRGTAALKYTGTGSTTDRLFSLGLGGGAIDSSGTGPLEFTNPGAMGFNGQTGARTLTLMGNSAYTSSLAAVIGDNGGPTSVSKYGFSWWTLSGHNTYSGPTLLAEGQLTATNSAALGTGPVTLGNNTTLRLAFTGTLDNPIALPSESARVTGDSPTLAGTISGNGRLAVEVDGVATLAGNNTYSGGTSIGGNTTLRIASAANLGSSSIVAFMGGTLQLNGSLTMLQANMQSGNATIDTHGYDLTGVSLLNGSGSLWKQGAGTLAVQDATSYAGTIQVDGGTLRLDTNFGGQITVNDGARLAGSAMLQNWIVLNRGAHLSPGDTFTGTLMFTNGLSLMAGSVLDFKLGSNGNDLVQITNGGWISFPSGSALTLNVSASGVFAAGTYPLFDFLGGTTENYVGADNFTLGAMPAGFTYSFLDSGTGLSLVATASAIPEPTTYAMLVGALSLGGAWLRRRVATRPASPATPAG